MPAVLPDDAVDNRQPEAGTPVARLGREEWLEDPFQHCRGHALAGIRNCDTGEPPGRPLAELSRGGGVEFYRLDRDRQESAVGHGVAGVEAEIEQNLLHLALVRLGHHRLRGSAKIDAYVLGNQAADHRQMGGGQAVEIDALPL